MAFFIFGYLVKVKLKTFKFSNIDFKLEGKVPLYIGAILAFIFPVLLPYHLSMSIYILVSALSFLMYLSMPSKRNFLFAIGIFMMSLVFFFYYSVDRRDWLAFILVYFISYIFTRKIQFGKFAVIGLIGFISIIYISIALRTNGVFDIVSVYDRVKDYSTFWAILEIETDFSIVYDDYVYLFSVLVDAPFLYGETFLKPLMSVFPREIFINKPISISSLFSREFNYEFYSYGGSEPITIFGETYWNFGYFSVVFFYINGAIFKYLDRMYIYSISNARVMETALIVALASSVFLILRGPADTFWLIHFFILFSFIIINLTLKSIKLRF
jgi:hypothetical protein